MAAQTTEAKKEEFRKYLEKSGVIDQLTRVLVGLYEQPEKPANSIELDFWRRGTKNMKTNNEHRFIKKFLGAPSDSDVDTLRSENEKLKEQVAALETKVQELEKELEVAREKQ